MLNKINNIQIYTCIPNGHRACYILLYYLRLCPDEDVRYIFSKDLKLCILIAFLILIGKLFHNDCA